MEKVIKNCPVCKKEFITTTTNINRGRGVNCSRECSYKAKEGKYFYNRKGINHKPETIRKYQERWKKIPHPRGMKGKKHTQETKNRIRKSLSGSNCYLWKDGKTILILAIRTCLEYRVWRLEVFSRDKFTCIKCGDNKGGNLEADHIEPLSYLINKYKIKTLQGAINCQELWNIKNGRTLCKSCHKKTKTYGEGAKKYKKI